MKPELKRFVEADLAKLKQQIDAEQDSAKREHLMVAYRAFVEILEIEKET